jgi:phosphopantetheine--protein transferase-like protein
MNEEMLREIVSGIARLDRDQITPVTALGDLLRGSLGRARLDAALRTRLGISSPAVYRAATYGELQRALSGDGSAAETDGERRPSSSAPPGYSLSVPPVGDGIAVGIDVESIRSLPDVADYWEDEFCRSMFTSQEIAYALLQTQPGASLAAAWCAKEALRKSNSRLINVDWARIEVVHDPEGKPSLRLDGVPVQGSLSLSHTDEIAIAAFVAHKPETPPVDSVLPAAAVATIPARKSSPAVAVAAWLALLLAAASIAIQFLRR